MSQEIREKMTQVLVEEFGIPHEEISFAEPYGDLGFDSLLVLELALAMQGPLGVKVTEQEIADAGSLGSLAELLRAKAEVVA